MAGRRTSKTAGARSGERTKLQSCILGCAVPLTDLLIKPIAFAFRFDDRGEGRLTGFRKEHLNADQACATLLFASLRQSFSEKQAPHIIWERNIGSHEALLDGMASLMGVAFWCEVAAGVVTLLFALHGGHRQALEFVWSVLFWVFVRMETFNADFMLIPYFLILENLVLTSASLVMSAKYLLPLPLYIVKLAALVLLAYAVPIRLQKTLAPPSNYAKPHDEEPHGHKKVGDIDV